MGGQAEEIFTSFGLNEDDSSNYMYNTVQECFTKHFVKQCKLIYDRTHFNQRDQQQGETVKLFVTALHSLTEHCKYGILCTQIIRDHLVVGLLDANLSKQLQLEADLKLEDAIAGAHNSEAVNSQQIMMRSSATSLMHIPVVVDAVQFHSKGKRPHRNARASADIHSARKVQLSHPPPTRIGGW